MSNLGEILMNGIRQKMEFYKRNASGLASESLREVEKANGIEIRGIDYFEEIFNGTLAGTNVSIGDLQSWKAAKEGRYSITLPSAEAVKTSIFNGGGPKNTDSLHIDTKVLNENKSLIDKTIKDYINRKIYEKV